MEQNSNSQKETIKVLYAGSLLKFGAVSTHPQFHHLIAPPSGYEFILPDVVTLANLPQLAGSAFKFFVFAVSKGAKPEEIINFIKTRGLRTQLQIAVDVKLAFLPTWPYIINQIPWVIEPVPTVGALPARVTVVNPQVAAPV